mmetsp:Transcript_8590/g.38297  ORF Transcript_8590/g.38297 Transcript_8590/m.38297 type:complete len:347 (-) Transcript_8590:1484-2524(-)
MDLGFCLSAGSSALRVSRGRTGASKRAQVLVPGCRLRRCRLEMQESSSETEAKVEDAAEVKPDETVSEVAEKVAKDETGDEPPPSTFYQAVTQAQEATELALSKGFRLLEVEFPPLPQSMLDSAAIGTYTVVDANYKLVLDYAKRWADQGKRVAIAFPDAAEKDRAVENSNEMEEPYPNIRLSTLVDGFKGTILDRLLTAGVERDVSVREDDDMFIVMSASCQELPQVEKMCNKAGERPVIFFNLKLDTLRGDLGLPAFPPKDLQYRFLSSILPVYYLRQRSYSKTVPQPPYVVNYSGALFRAFPGKYQVRSRWPLISVGVSVARSCSTQMRESKLLITDEMRKSP